MSIDLYKAEASRLADHLAVKHGFKLKSGAALEAIAAVHGARDWNTLAARGHLAAVSHGVRIGTNPSPASFEALADDLLLRHVLFSGSPGRGASIGVEATLQAHARRGGQFILLEGAPAPRKAEGALVAGQRVARIHVTQVGSPLPANLLADKVLDRTVRRIVDLLPRSPEASPGGTVYREQAFYAMSAVLGGFAQQRDSLSVRELVTALQDSRALEELYQKLANSPARDLLNTYLVMFRKNTKVGPQLDTERIAQAMGGLLGRLAQHQNMPSMEPLALEPLLEAGDSCHLIVDARGSEDGAYSARTQMQWAFAQVKRAIAARPASSAPLMLVLSRVLGNLSEDWEALLAQLTAAGVAVVFHEHSFRAFSQLGAVASSVYTWYLLEPQNRRDMAAMVEEGLTPSQLEQVSELGMGQALRVIGAKAQVVELL